MLHLLATLAALLSTATAYAVNVDFLWVIDNSRSMAEEQSVLSATADRMAMQLAHATCPIDWRIAVTYTDLHNTPGANDVCPGAPGPGRRRICPFTRDIDVFRDGIPECAYTRPGTCGDGSERGFFSAGKAIGQFLAGSGCEPVPGGECSLRPDARLALIFFTDTGERSPNGSPPPGQPDGSVASWVEFFRDYDLLAAGQQRAQVHGILCPFRPTPENPAPCSDTLSDPALFERYSEVIRQLGGAEASIRDDDESSLADSIARIVDVTIAGACCGDGAIELGEACDDGNTVDGDCCSASCQLEPPTLACRPATDACDAPEFCTGESAGCPPDAFMPAAHECRAAVEPCDIAEVCTGESAGCPPDAFMPAAHECRAAVEPCDIAEVCTGESPACPADLQLDGSARLGCLCAAGLAPPSCAAEGVPRPVARRFARACLLFARAAERHGPQADRLLTRAHRCFKRAGRAALRAEERGRIGNACARSLFRSLVEVGELMR